MNCYLSFGDSKPVELLTKRLGTDVTRLQAVWGLATDESGFTQEFVDYVKNKRGIEDFTIETADNDTIVDDLISYYNTKRPDGNLSSNIDPNPSEAAYGGVTNRNFCIARVGDEVNDIFRQLRYEEGRYDDVSRKEYIDRTIASFLTRLINQVPGMEDDEIDFETVSGTDTINFLETIDDAETQLGADITDQQKVLIALCREMVSDTDNFFNNVFSLSKLQPITKTFAKDSIDKEIDQANNQREEEMQNEDGTTDDTKDSVDLSFLAFESHSGQYATFMTHIGGSINSYLSSIRRCLSTRTDDGNYDYNTGNCVGIADCYSASELSALIYSTADFSNLNNFIESIKKIAENTPGYAGLIMFYDDLNNNLDFAAECYRTFAKMVISKKEVVVDTIGNASVRISNVYTTRTTALRHEMFNAIKSNAYAITPVTFNDYIGTNTIPGKIARGIQRYNNSQGSDIALREVCADIHKLLSIIFPNISESAVLNYVRQNKSLKDGLVHESDNLTNLYRAIASLRETCEKISTAQTAHYRRLYEINRHNRSLINESLNGASVRSSEYKSDEAELAWDVTAELGSEFSKVSTLAEMLSPYSVVSIELNSRNANHNLSSDVFNNNMISALKEILTSELNNIDDEETPINRFKNYKFRSKQYNFSTILLEHSENGRIINYGLFRLVDGKYEPTEYFDQLIEFANFNGIVNTGTGDNAVYADCTKADYFTTIFETFVKDKQERKYNREQKDRTFFVTSYFMRTPADAPKNFIFTAPVYDVGDLFIPDNINIDSFQFYSGGALGSDQMWGKIARSYGFKVKDYTPQDWDSLPENWKYKLDKEYNVVVKLLGRKVLNIDSYAGKLVRRDMMQADKADAIFAIGTVASNGYIDGGTGYASTRGIIRGIPIYLFDQSVNIWKKWNYSTNKFEQTEIPVLTKNAAVIGTRELIQEGTNAINDVIKKTLGNKIKLNRNHPIFKQFYNQFVQEAQDAATAVYYCFEQKDGTIAKDENTGAPILSSRLTEGRSNTKAIDVLFDNYHKKGSKIVEVKDDTDGRHVTLLGNVFHSGKFTLFKDGQLINYLEDIFDDRVVSEETEDAGRINILYGRASRLNIDSNGTVVLTDAQKAAVEDAIERFINDYIEVSLTRARDLIKTEIDPKEKDARDTQIIECCLNYRLAYYAANDLFEGDVKFYKNTQDFFKRAKETQGAGVPYSVKDFTTAFVPNTRTEVTSYLNDAEIQQELASLGLTDCKAYSTFRAVTVANTVKTDKAIKEASKKVLVDAYRKEGLTKKDAEAKANEIVSGFDEIKTNDAQSYITFEEWIRRISARGQLNQYLPLIRRICDENTPLSPQDLTEFIQVQKNFYYDMQYDEATGVMTPRQIKNAEFVLVPRLIRGTDLEAVYHAMIESGVDQLNTVETSKAGKHNILKLWDNEGNPTSMKEFRTKAKEAVELYSYNFLYTQQEGVQHMNDYNKFGLQISKKVLDNIDKNSPLYPYKEAIQKCLCANIKESWSNLMKELGVDTDEKGISLKLDGKGNLLITGIKPEVIIEKLKDELIRTGITSNLADYVTLTNDETLDTNMPWYIGNQAQKMENVIQSIFNRSITRQKLPGFHAAQITRIGFRDFTKDKTSGYPKEIKYNPETRICEVLLPYSAFGFDATADEFKGMSKSEIDEILLKRLQREGLDKVIGYRIPTEAKMSSQVMQVVGFLPSEYGSTIVVPDEWVALTGSDFDIDSVYGIQYNTYDYKGNPLKVEYIDYDNKDDVSKNPEDRSEQGKEIDRRLYNAYVLRNLSKEERNKLFENAKLEQEEINELREDETIDKTVQGWLGKAISQESRRLFNELIDSKAKSKKLQSFKEYSSTPVEERNTRKARENHILDSMIKILTDAESAIESMSQSKFTNITDKNGENGAIQHVLGKSSPVAIQRQNRSPYDVLDQADNFEDATMGMTLKGISVANDTFCSICNTVKPVFREGIVVRYDASKFDIKELRKRFGKDNVESDGKYIIVTHKTYGWSNDNKNVTGDLITAYSAQTTAHILDAIKEGAVPNVTTDTFGVYKLLVSAGIDFDTDIAFMAQPIITSLVKNIAASKSVYTRSNSVPYNETIKELARKLGITTETTKGKNNFKVSRPIREITKEIEDLIKTDKIVLDYEALKKRFDTETPTREDYLFDYLILKNYKELADKARKITNIALVCNPDKFGAKSTIFETQKVFDDVDRVYKETNPVFEGDFLDSIFPGIRKGVNDYLQGTNEGSAYPSLHYYMKYATATSLKFTSQLFPNHSPEFEGIVRRITRVMSSRNPNLTEERYKDFANYVLNYLYSRVGIISCPVTFVKGVGIVPDSGTNEEERNRIYGYGRRADISYLNENGEPISFNFKDINNPTDEEIANFAKLSPAQKVAFIQNNFRDSLIGKYLRVSLTVPAIGNSTFGDMQTIRYIEDSTDIELLYEEFRKMYCNTNPYLALTAMDIIKYSIVVEGMQMRRGAINKVISNKVLYTEYGPSGTGFVDAVKGFMNDVLKVLDEDTINELLENYIRGHVNIPEIAHVKLTNEDKAKVRPTYVEGKPTDIYYTQLNEETMDWLEQRKFGWVLNTEDAYGQPIREFIPFSYIELNFGVKNEKGQYNKTLYKIVKRNDNTGIYLIPLNKLQPNEFATYSVNLSNSRFGTIKDYQAIVTELTKDDASTISHEVIKNAQEEIAKGKADLASQKTRSNGVSKNELIDINSDRFLTLRNQITAYFDGSHAGTLYLNNDKLRTTMPQAASKDAATGEVKDNGQTVIIDGQVYRIWKPNTTKKIVNGKRISIFHDCLEHPEMPIPEELLPYKDLIDQARANKRTELEPFAVRLIPNPSSIKGSTITDVAARADMAIRRRARQGDANARVYVRNVNSSDVIGNKEDDQRFRDSFISTAQYVSAAVEELLNGEKSITRFVKNGLNELSCDMASNEALEVILKDDDMRQRFLYNILEAHRLINQFKEFAGDTMRGLDGVQFYLDDIAKNIEKLEKNPILARAEKMYIEKYLTNPKVTSNPNIRRGIQDLYDSFYTTGAFEAAFNDLQESGNPMLQIITSNVMKRISASQLQALDTIRDFQSKFDKITAAANAAGSRIDWDKLVDENGNWREEFTPKLREDFAALNKQIEDNYEKYKAIEDKPENIMARRHAFALYLRAKRNKAIWMLKNMHQALKDDYYVEMLNAEKNMMINENEFKYIYVEHEMLKDMLNNIRSLTKTTASRADLEEKKKEIDDAIKNLKSNYTIVGGEFELKPELPSTLGLTEDAKWNATINSLSSYRELMRYEREVNAIRDKYFQFTEKYGFAEELVKNLEIIRRHEIRDPRTGKLTVSPTALEQNEEYVQARDWVNKNARKLQPYMKAANTIGGTFATKVLTKYYNNELTDDYINQAYESAFGRTPEGEEEPSLEIKKENLLLACATKYFRETSIGGKVLSSVAKAADAYDNAGVIDGRKLNEAQRKAVKEDQERKFGTTAQASNSERRIYHSASNDDTIFTEEFWSHFKVGTGTNEEYSELVNEINGILRDAIDSSTGVLKMSNLTSDQLSELLALMKKLGYKPISQEFGRGTVNKKVGVTKSEIQGLTEFIDKYVENSLTDEERHQFDLEEAQARLKGDTFYELWKTINYEKAGDEYVPNHLFWGHLSLKDSVSEEDRNKFINKVKTAAIRVFKSSLITSPTVYYEQEHQEILDRYGFNSNEYREWFEANHVYNPNTGRMEAIASWTTVEGSDNTRVYEPAFEMTSRSPKEGMGNDKYREGFGAKNYKVKADRAESEIAGLFTGYETVPDGTYDSNLELNEYEAEIKKFVQETLMSLAKTKKSKEWFAQGKLPRKGVEESEGLAKHWLTELAKGFGFVERYGDNNWHRNLSYDTDTVPNMPMLSEIATRVPNEPIREEYEDDSSYEKAHDLWKEEVKEFNKKKKYVLDRNWREVISEFIKSAAHYNAVQANKYDLYFAQKLLDDIKTYRTRTPWSSVGKLVTEGGKEDATLYSRESDERLKEQYDIWLHRLIYNQFIKGSKPRILDIAQNLTSAVYMTYNIKGGIANVTVGEANILGEIFAGRYFHGKDWAKGKGIYFAALPSYITGAYSETATSLQDAIIKSMHVVDYDEWRGFAGKVGADLVAERIRNFGYSPLTAGEHFMQNSILFAMLTSHKLVKNPRFGEPGEAKYVAMNEEEYLRDADLEALKDERISTLEDLKKFEEFRNSIHQDPNKLKDYALYRRDIVQEFIIAYLPDKAKEYKKVKEEYRKAHKQEFANMESLYDQLALSENGTMTFKEGSKLAELNVKEEGRETTQAWDIMGKLRQRVISVNKKIHGNYGKLDAAKIESEWYGGLVMQYHKHIVPGFYKRFRRDAYYNEERGTIEKGAYISFYDFLTAPIKQIAEKNNMSQEETETMTAIQETFAYMTEYIKYFKLNWYTMSQQEKDNVKIVLGDFAAMLGSIMLACLIRMGWDDDDDSILYNFMLYEADRLYSESNMWTPFGAINEVKVLYSSPIAVQSITSDIFSSIDVISTYLMTGGDVDELYFTSGRHAGENKLKVWAERRIPYWRQWVGIRDIAKNNRFYKRSNSQLINTIPKAVANYFK